MPGPRHSFNQIADYLCLGMVFNHEWSRTITETDNMWFSLLTMNPQPLHIDAHFAEKTEFGQRLFNSYYTLAILIGMSVYDTTLGTTIGNLGMSDVRFPKPVFHGDTLYAETEVLEVRESRSKPDRGTVKVHTRVFNQDGTLVAEFKRLVLVPRKHPGEPRSDAEGNVE